MKSNKYRVAVVGATGNVGRKMLEILAERNFPAVEVISLASKESMGKQVSYGDKTIITKVLDDFDFKGVDIVLSSPGANITERYAERAIEAGCVIIDNTSFFRKDPNIPLVVPEVNGAEIKNFANNRVIANPNCNVIPIVMVLNALRNIAAIKRVVISTYQSTSGAGKRGMDELYLQTKSIYENAKLEPETFPRPIAFNVIPQVGEISRDGITEEEEKTAHEIKKILGEDVAVSATCVRVPVFIGHSASINVEFYDAVKEEEAMEAISEAEGILLVDNRQYETYMTPIEIAGEDAVYVSRLREDKSQPNTLNMWIVSDNLRKGAALNAVQIAEELINKYL